MLECPDVSSKSPLSRETRLLSGAQTIVSMLGNAR
jgi:hypothetical protein